MQPNRAKSFNQLKQGIVECFDQLELLAGGCVPEGNVVTLVHLAHLLVVGIATVLVEGHTDLVSFATADEQWVAHVAPVD